jgi:hypothetical protein
MVVQDTIHLAIMRYFPQKYLSLIIMKTSKNLLGIALIFTMIMFNCCGLNDSIYSKDDHLKTTKIRDSLYSEVFFIRSMLSDNVERYSEYITDSVNFRKYIYTYNSGEWIYGEMSKNDILTIYKITGKLLSDGQTVFDTTKIDTYNINKLKQEGKFE